MTDLIINGTAARHSSLGARRYFGGIMAHLEWPGRVITSPPAANPRLVRVKELFDRGRRDAIYWSPAHRGPLFAHNHVVTVLDCINIEHTYSSDWRLPLLRANLMLLMGQARRIVTISAATKAAILRNFSIDPEKIVVIPGPIDLPLLFEPVEPKPELVSSGPFILMVTNALPHKNTTRAAQALAASRAAACGATIRVVGSISSEARAACLAANLKVEEHRGIDDATLDAWIRQSMFLMSPSLDEGLNLPIADSVRVGTNVICSDIAVHREFYDGSVVFFDPANVEAIRFAVDDALEREGCWFAPQIKPQFGVATVADSYRQLFQQIV
jgi:glycosyltransferase involved in cell wall biosynthesis